MKLSNFIRSNAPYMTSADEGLVNNRPTTKKTDL
jgi:hypothetical protein